MEALLNHIISTPPLHARWLNTLSMLENAGAKKIKKCEHPIFVNEVILKHAAEEARHAWYLKKQLSKIAEANCPTYETPYILTPTASYHYLNKLDVSICRYLRHEHKLQGDKLKYAAYLLVTYAIEVRADELYPQYQKALKANKSTVTVRNIIAEEKNHLEEMQKQLKEFSPDWKLLCEQAQLFEAALYDEWIAQLKAETSLEPSISS